MPQTVRTCLWFEKGGLEAARFYTSLIPGSKLDLKHWRGNNEPIVVDFTLAGTPYQILNGGPLYKLTPAASISVLTNDQGETDHYWNSLIADGGAESRCGWLFDRWGVSWQIVPRALLDMQTADDREAAARVNAAMLEMNKIIIAGLEAAFNGN